MALVEMPSCECDTNNRNPRFNSGNNDDTIIIHKTSMLTTYIPVTRAHEDYTVSITINGCIPTDVIITSECNLTNF